MALLKLSGLNIASLNDLMRLDRLPHAAVEIILSQLPRVHERNLKEIVIRSFGAAERPFDGSVLAQEFDADRFPGTLRWPIANTMALARPTNINAWIRERVTDPNVGDRARDARSGTRSLCPTQ